MATLYSRGIFPFHALMQLARSAGLIRREASAMSVALFCNAAKPTPEPPPLTWIFTSGCFFMYTSAHFWARMTRVSEPLTVILPAWEETTVASVAAVTRRFRIVVFIADGIVGLKGALF